MATNHFGRQPGVVWIILVVIGIYSRSWSPEDWGLVAAFATAQKSHHPFLLLSASTVLDVYECSVNEVLEGVRQDHNREVEYGFSLFGRSSEASTFEEAWSDQDFTCRHIEAGKAGPDEFFLERGNHVFQTITPVISVAECEALIQEAKLVIHDGLLSQAESNSDDDSRILSNSQLGEARLSQLPGAIEWVKQALHERFFPILQSRFGVPASELTLQDALIIGYGYLGGDGSRSQPVHRDASLLALNVALSPISNYQGGGTFFEGLQENSVMIAEQGHVLCHAGGLPHAGRGLDSGERWILVLFCVAKSYPQLARRCHANGMTARSENDLECAKLAFEAGLVVAPSDHLLQTSLGGVYNSIGNQVKAHSCLHEAALSYPDCHKANLALGNTMLEKRRPRAALRRFDAILDYWHDRDLDADAWMPRRAAGWEARVSGARAALICSMHALQHEKKSFDSRYHLDRAVQRLYVARESSPGDDNILGMLRKAEELLSDEALYE
jgi:hypothetical protein